ncbi:YtxH domain-containing protein [Streptococcus merionis]|uniref:YtxH domain-containing protein n=1 Tax=Streptococcus merionis TaxID=400065 RepID=UPI003514C54A
MSKSNKFFTTILLGAAGGAAAAVFLASKSGKVVKEKVLHFMKDYQDDPESKHTEWVDKATDLKNQAFETYNDVRHKFETGELTADDIVMTVKDKATELKDRVTQEDFFANLKDQVSKAKADFADTVSGAEDDLVDDYSGESISEEITIDLNETDLLADDVVASESEVLEEIEKSDDLV